MQYLLLIYENEGAFAGLSEAEQGKIFQEYMDYTEGIRKQGNYIAGEALQPISTATTVRVKNGKTLTTDGPFADTKEVIAGYFVEAWLKPRLLTIEAPGYEKFRLTLVPELGATNTYELRRLPAAPRP